jgi:hypothetical protein
MRCEANAIAPLSPSGVIRCAGARVSLQREDLSTLENGAMTILVRRAKNDPFGDGRYGFLTSPTAQLLVDWLVAARIEQGFLFRRITGHWIGRANATERLGPWRSAIVSIRMRASRRLDRRA